MDIKGFLFSLVKPAAPSGSVNLPFQVDVNGPNTSVSVSAPIATSGAVGLAKPDNATITVAADGSLTAGAPGTAATLTNMAALRALGAPTTAVSVVVEGYYAAGDGGGGTFVWDTSSTAADNGGTIILPTGYGGTGRWRRLYSGAVFAKWFGAKGDGTTDDSAAIQSAITVAASGWKKVAFDGSTYACGSAATLTLSTDKLILEGQDGTILKFTSSSTNSLVITANYCTVQFIEFDGNKGSLSGTNNNLFITGAYNSILNCRTHDSRGIGICFDGQSTTCANNTARNCASYSNNGSGISHHTVTDGIIRDCIIYSNGNEGLTFDVAAHRCSAIGNRIDGNCTLGGVGNIGVDGSDDCRVIGNSVTNCASGLAGIKTQNNTGATNRLVVTGNTITGNGSAGGVWLHNGGGGITSACLVDSNEIYNNGTTSILVDSGCTNNMIAGNNLNGNAVSDSGTGTTIIQSTGSTYSAGAGLSLSGTTFSLATPVSVASGGTGTASPSLVAGANVTVTGSWPNQTIAASGGSSSPLTTKGDLFGHSTVDARIPIGADGTILTADSTQALGLKWAAAGGGSFAGRLLGIQRITTTGAGTYTPTAGTSSILIELQAGGGGGSGVASPGGSSIYVGAGGASGGWLRKYLTANFSGASYSVGAKGSGGASGNNNGVTGGDTSFTTTGGSPTTYTAHGGVGGGRNGPFTAAFVAGVAGSSTATTGGDDNQSSQAGCVPIALSVNNNIGGSGGSSPYSGGSSANVLGGTNTSAAGGNADGKGGGGSGAVATGTGGAVAGGNGSDGVLIIWEYS